MTWLRAWVLAVLFGSLPPLAVAACAALTPANSAAVEQTAGDLATCKAVNDACLADAGKDAGATCYGLYEACTHDAGLP